MNLRLLLSICVMLQIGAGLSGAESGRVRGIVRDASGPVAGATVRNQGTAQSTKTGPNGEFSLDVGGAGRWASLAASAPGYFIAGPVSAQAGASGLVLTLARHAERDNPGYQWASAYRALNPGGACELCHSRSASGGELPFDEWIADAHGTSAVNPRFLSVYNGTGRGPGYRLDFPHSTGNCGTCHVPMGAATPTGAADPNSVQGVTREGVGCDLCHKMWGVRVNQQTGTPHADAPGVLSIEFRRPGTGHQLFLGPYDDVAPSEDSFSALQNQSLICAPCHYGKFHGVEIYNSWGEWLASPYAGPNGRTCQDCHMPRRGATHISRGESGALARDPQTVFSHLMPGAADVDLLRATATLELTARREAGEVQVSVRVVNSTGGHHVPTDHPARNMLLVLAASDSAGRALERTQGPVIPDWGGRGHAADDYAGRPGRGYAKVLRDLRTGQAPSIAYWNPTEVVEDTRIPAKGQDVSTYRFRTPAAGTVRVTARLIFRRAFKDLAREKAWNTPDIPMAEAELDLPAAATAGRAAYPRAAGRPQL